MMSTIPENLEIKIESWAFGVQKKLVKMYCVPRLIVELPFAGVVFGYL